MSFARCRRRWALLAAVGCAALISGGCAGERTGSATTTSTAVRSSTTAAPDGLKRCEAPTYAVDYPADWFTNGPDDGDPCEWFHPEPFQIPKNSEAAGIAIHLRYDEVDFDFVTDPSNHSEEVVDFERTEIDGLPAARFRTRSKGEGLLDVGVESITWYINAASVTFSGATHGVAQPGLDTNGPVLDDMIESLRFRPTGEGAEAPP